MTDNPAAKALTSEIWDTRLKWVILAAIGLLVVVLPIRSTTTIRDSLIILATVAWAGRIRLRGKEVIAPSGLEAPFIIFTLTVLISLIFSINLPVSLKELRGELFKNILLFYLVFCNFKEEGDARPVVWALVVCSIAFGVGTIVVFILKAGPKVMPLLGKKSLTYIFEHVVVPYRSGGYRDSGGLVAGLYHSLFLAYLGAYLVARAREFPRALVLLALVLNLAAIALTFSRAAWLALVLEIFLLGFLFYGRRGIICVALPLLLIGAAFFKAGWIVRVDESVRTEGLKNILRLSPKEVEGLFGPQSSLGHRMGSLKYNLDIVLKNPLKPHGFGRDMDRKRDTENAFIQRYTDPHNSFLGLAYQLGVQGLLAFCYLVFALLRRLWPKQGVEGWPRTFALATWVMVAGFMVNIFFGSFWGDDQALMFWLLGGLGMNAAGGFTR